MFESAYFIDKGNSHKSHYHKASKTTYKRVKIYLKLLKLANSAKSDLTGDKCNKVFINNALIKRLFKLKSFKMQQYFDIF